MVSLTHQGKTYESPAELPPGTANVKVFENGILIDDYLEFPDGSHCELPERAEVQGSPSSRQEGP
jgi:hypothetical protein